MSDRLTIGLFGPMRVLVSGAELGGLRSRKALWVLGLLALRAGRQTSREWIATRLWPDAEHAVALANLRPVLSELRQALGKEGQRILTPDRANLALDLDGVSVDVLEFDEAVKKGELAKAIEIYSGPLLEGCQEEWVLQDRSEREDRCSQAYESLGTAALEGGEHRQAIELYRRLIALAPWRDSARRGLMAALAGAGDVNEALQAYRDFATLLSREIGTIPDEKTTALYMELRQSLKNRKPPAAAAPAKPIGNISHSTTLVGLEDERLDVRDRLRRNRLVTLIGFGGIGKTRLAREVAIDISREFADGVWFIALDSVFDEELVAHRIALTLGVPDTPGRSLLQNLADWLRDRQALLILDNCEQVVTACSQICEELLKECGGLHILATSREPLGMLGEKVWRTAPLSVPDLAHLPEHPATLLRVIGSFESVQLFVERARSADDEFRLSPENALIVAEVCVQLEGIPLAIELAAAYVKAISMVQIAQRARSPLSFLDRGARSGAPRQQTLRATIEWSFGFLDEESRQVLTRTASFVGGWTPEAAEAVCGGDGIQPERVLSILASLVDKSLVIYDPRSEGGGRYRLLETVRQYALAQPSEDGRLLRSRFVDYFCTSLERLTESEGAERELGFERAQVEEANVRQALQWAEESPGLLPFALRIASAWGVYWFTLGRFGEGLRHLRQALEKDDGSAPKLRARALSVSSSLASAAGQFHLALDLQTEALETYRELGDRDGIAFAARTLGDVYDGLGQRSTALAFFEESYRSYRDLGNERASAVLNVLAGSCLGGQGHVQKASERLEEGKEYFVRSGELRGVSWVLNYIGNVYMDNGSVELALAPYEEALRVEEEAGGHASSYFLDNLAKASSLVGKVEEARRYAQRALDNAKQHDDRRVKAIILRSIGEIENEAGNFGAALESTRNALRLMNLEDSSLDANSAFCIVGRALMGLGNAPDGLALLAAARGNQERLGVELLHLDQVYQGTFERIAATLLDKAAYEEHWERGYRLSMSEAFDLALCAVS